MASIMSKNVPAVLPSSSGGDMLPHISARRRHMIVDTVFEMSGGVERLADWADRNYGDFIQSVWIKGLPKAVATEHTVGSGVEDVLARLEAKEAEAAERESKVIDITPRNVVT